MLAFPIPNLCCPPVRWCLVFVWSFLPAALVAGGGEPVFRHRSEVLRQDLVDTAPTLVIDDLGLQLIAAEFTADMSQIGGLLRPSPNANVGTGVGSAWPSAPNELRKGTVYKQALLAMRLPEVRKPESKNNGGKDLVKEKVQKSQKKKPSGKDAQKENNDGKEKDQKTQKKEASGKEDTQKEKNGGKDKSQKKKPGGNKNAQKEKIRKTETKKPGGKDDAQTEELLTSLYLWFAVGSLFVSSVLCCCVPVIDPENMLFNMTVDLAIVASVICIALDFANKALVNSDMHEHLILAQNCFTAFFLLEIVVRIRALGLWFFAGFWGIFDFTLVLAAVSEFWILPIASHLFGDSLLETLEEYHWLPYFLRSLRLLRLLRLFRSEGVLRHHDKEKEKVEFDDLTEVWVMIPTKDAAKPGKSRSKKRTPAAP